MDFISVQEAAKNWGISERRIQKVCEENRIEGVIKFNATSELFVVLLSDESEFSFVSVLLQDLYFLQWVLFRQFL